MTTHLKTLCLAFGLALATTACERATETSPPAPGEAPPAPGAPTTGAPAPPAAPSAAPTAPVAGAEREFVAQAAASGLAEVEASQMVASRTNDPDLKSYAEKLEREHRAVNDELQRIARDKGIDLPATTEGEPRERLNKLSGLSGADLRKTYLQEFGVDAHQKSIELFERQAKEGQDAELRQFAEKTLTSLREHLVQAQQLQGGGGGGPS